MNPWRGGTLAAPRADGRGGTLAASILTGQMPCEPGGGTLAARPAKSRWTWPNGRADALFQGPDGPAQMGEGTRYLDFRVRTDRPVGQNSKIDLDGSAPKGAGYEDPRLTA